MKVKKGEENLEVREKRGEIEGRKQKSNWREGKKNEMDVENRKGNGGREQRSKWR